MCLKEDDALGFHPTGIMLVLQDNILGLEVNGLSPRKWCVCKMMHPCENDRIVQTDWILNLV